MAERPELTARKATVLHTIVEAYVATGEPVGSEAIADRAKLGVSSATIRNEMAALEEQGYLSHPHTSAGRIPTDAGYRHYVDALPAPTRLKDAQRRQIASHFAEVILDLEEVLKGSVHLLSRLTQYAGLAVPPGASDEHLVRLEVIDMGPTLAGARRGTARSRRQADHRPAGAHRRARRWPPLNGGSTRCAARRTSMRKRRSCQMAATEAPGPHDVLLIAADVLRMATQGERAGHVVVGGVANLTDDAQAWRRDTLRRLVETLEREQEMVQVLQDVAPAEDVRVTIGDEHPTTGAWGASIVAAPFTAGDATVGTIGIVGPTRMDYFSAMAAVRAVAKRLSDAAEAEQ